MDFKNRLNGMMIALGVLTVSGVVLVAAGLALMLMPSPDPGTTDAAAPNVVLIVLDAFRLDRVGATRNGVPLTPFLDALEGESAVFTNAIANCTWTRPVMASLYTSMYLEAHQVVFDTSEHGTPGAFAALSPELPTIATSLKDAGYHTACIQTNGNLFPELGFHRGFDVYRTSLDAAGTLVTDWALEEVHALRQPFFLYAHYMDPHLPYDPPLHYREMFGYSPDALSSEERAIVESFREYYTEHCRFMTGQIPESPFPPLSEAGREAVNVLYDALIRYTDDEVRRLVESVRSQAPDTLFIVVADHGEHFWDHGFLGHGLTLYDCELRVPLYLFGSRVNAGTIDAVVETVDILPTLAGLLGLPRQDTWQGRDAFNSGERPAYAKTMSISPAWNTDQEMVIAGGMKLIVDRQTDRVQLFNWHEDAGEERNLAEQRPEEVGRLMELLQQHHLLNLRARRGAREEAALDEETLEQLRRLGYIH